MNLQLQKLHQDFCRKQILNNCTPRTIKWYRNSFEYYAKATKTRKIQDITQYHLEIFFFEGITQRKWKDTTYMSYYKAIKSFLRWCTEEGYFEVNPIEKISKRKGKNQYIPEYYSKEKVRSILSAVTSNYQNDRFLFVRNYAIISTLIHSGIRKNELLRLEEDSFDFEQKVLSVKASKWNKDREIPITDNLAIALKRYVIERNKKQPSSSQLFISHTKKKITEDGLNHFFNNLSELVDFKVSSHRFRHTYATMLRRAGVDLKTISRLLGHSSIQATLIYSHVVDDDLIDTVNSKLPKFI
ncbi:tyrosine-type recombinase/integrase [Candidatus Uabimicrobium sp. HlEnr_7]|uniref:tyrosine-type recombinase/integrase n=1 Tax=Candidatus Uabimicrobium helgolandensis TaxID=3095367 RepID=UPI003557D8E5